MRAIRTLGTALVLAGTIGASAAMADNQPQRYGTSIQPQIGQANPGILVPIVQCIMGSGDVLADVLIKNNSSVAIAPGTQIYWQTNGGQSGVANTGLPGLAPGAVLHAGGAPYPFTCTASIAH